MLLDYGICCSTEKEGMACFSFGVILFVFIAYLLAVEFMVKLGTLLYSCQLPYVDAYVSDC